ncbi:MAG: glutamate--tRNA ligase family protein, partial [candidate division Zixibacteria bacterium]|nr:glutamate--tRNA ligase family protein [candidate division Zixibacteria bacterium]
WAREQDHVVQRTDGTCLYHLANVVDDRDFQITHVIRAEEHLSNTPRQVFILEALGYPRPIYAHLPFVAEPGSRNKLSKRKLDKYLKNRDFAQLVEHGRKIAQAIGHAVEADAFNPVIVDFYRTVGYLPEAIINYLALLGWSLDDKSEHFSRQELIEKFSLERVNKAPASFDPKKLQAFEDWHFQQLPPEQKIALETPFPEKAKLVQSPPTDDELQKIKNVSAAAGDRIKVAGDILDYDYFFLPYDKYEFDTTAFQKHLSTASDADLLLKFKDRIERIPMFGIEVLKEALLDVAEPVLLVTLDASELFPSDKQRLFAESLEAAEAIEAQFADEKVMERWTTQFAVSQDVKIAAIIHKVRVAITGRPVGLGLFHSMMILGREEVLKRINRAFRTMTAFHPPEALEAAVDFSAPEKPIPLHEGQLVLRYEDRFLQGTGIVALHILPTPAVRFQLCIESLAAKPECGQARLEIPELAFSVEALVTRLQIKSGEPATISGIPNGESMVGTGENLSSVVFHLTGFHDYIGGSIRDKVAHHFWAGRLNLAARDWLITIDAVSNLGERREAAARYGGTPVTHVGKLERCDGAPFTSTDCNEVITLVQFFLSFVRGRWVTPLIPVGFDHRGNRVWQDWTLRRIGRDPGFDSWCPVHDIRYVESLFPQFCARWMDSTWREFLRPAINTYLHGNKQGLLDDTIIFAQIVLEMAADFILVEQTGQFPATTTEAAAAERIRLLFQRVSIPTEIPDQLANLRRFAETEQTSSGLEVVTRIRNACVHHNAEGRRFLARLASEKYAFYDASRLALWYADLCLLWLIGYDGRYQSRIHAKWVGETETVPWAKPLEYPLESSTDLR